MGGLGKLIGAAVGGIAKAGIAASKWGKLNTLLKPIPMEYKDDNGKEHYYTAVLAKDKDLGEGPTLLLAGDIGGSNPSELEKSIISGFEQGYFMVLNKQNSKNAAKGKFSVREQNLVEYSNKLCAQLGIIYAAAISQSKYLREELAKTFKDINYYKDEYTAVPVAKKKFQGDYFLKWNLKGKEYRAPVDGVAKPWRNMKVLTSDTLAELSEKFYKFPDEDKKGVRDLRSEIKGYIKGVLKGEAQ